MVRVICVLLVIICFANCKSEIKSAFTSKDTNAIIKVILDDKRLLHEMIKKPDTLFMIKSKKINKNWLSETDKFKLVYIDRTKENEDLIDLSPAAFYDKRVRIDFGDFTFNKDTANVSLALYQNKLLDIYHYRFKYEDEGWTIVNISKVPH